MSFSWFQPRRLVLPLLLAACVLGGRSRDAAATHEPPSNFVGVRLAPMANSQGDPRVCSDGEGGAIVVFSVSGNAGLDLHAQRFGAAGTTLWNVSGMPICTTPESQWGHTACSDGAGGAIVFWSDMRGGGGIHYDIFAQRIGPTGAPVWKSQGVPVMVAPNDQLYPRAISDGAGGAIVSWYDYGPSNAVLGVHAQRVNADGDLLWGADGVTLSALSSTESEPVIVSDGAGGAIIVWTDDRNGTIDLFGQRVTAEGVPAWRAGGSALCTAAGMQLHPTTLANGSGGALLAWEDTRASGAYDLYVQNVDASGAPQWTPGGVPLCVATGDQFRPQLASDGAGGAAAVWMDHRNAMGVDLYAQRIDPTGTPLWGSNGMALSTAARFQAYPRIVADGDGGVIVAWQDDRTTADAYDIYIQGLDPSGAPRWAAGGLALCTARNGQVFPDLIMGLDGAAIVAWSDGREYSYSNVFALKTPQDVVGVAPLDDGALSFAAPGPNPSGGAVALEFKLPAAGPVRLSVHDVTGRRVRLLIDDERGAGVHRENFDLRAGAGPSLASGLYLVRLEAGGMIRTQRLAVLR